MRRPFYLSITGLLVLVACLALPPLLSAGPPPATGLGESAWDLYAASQVDAGLDGAAYGERDGIPAAFERRSQGLRVANGDDDDDDDDDDDGGDDQICLCHVPPGNPGNAQTICVDRSAVCAHLSHGDNIGDCPAPCGGESGATCEEGQFCKLPEGECDPIAEGECADLPVVCPSIFDPVCGCDGRTYSTACFANVAGVAIDHTGACEEAVACGGAAGDTCEDDQYCKRPLGECNDESEGACADKPAACPDVQAPVCGCDGATYANACLAAGAGVNVDHEGECEEPTACGGTAGDTCGEDEFCNRPDGECEDDAEGTCLGTPQTCPAILDPVCGCDGTTYDNRCVAQGAGVTVDHEGECFGPTACGGAAGDTCRETQFCSRPEGECAEDAEGVCAPRPVFCSPLIAPVCGCDGETYSNACIARAVGVTVDHDGECAPTACGGTAGGACGEGEFCDRPDGECGEGAVGVCAPTPPECGTENAPVCGCDGTTYGNACLADVAGVTVDHEGACAGPTACGGTAGDTCRDTQFCARPKGECAEDAEGVCAPRPLFCSPLVAPVCGCDGESYDNACIARAVGVTVDHDGECAPTVCGGTAGDTCGEDEYCDRADGECGAGAVGVCAPTPADCGTENAPVCGCDGTTYDNACLADVAGVTVDHTGACGAPTACGGTAGDTCGELQYCARPKGECAEDAEGVCAPRAIFCSPVIAPVCGCDGESYDNACIARAVGVTVDHDGECAPTVCGGTAGDTCGEDEYCDRADGECGAGAVGVCAPTPADCGAENAPVCGCDGTTYDNACLADVAGVTVDHTGACGAPTACGGTAGDTCGELQYCARPKGECAEDAAGVCAPRAIFCSPVIAPVCGCDGESYDNACIARAVGVTVDHDGECAPTVCGGTAGDTCGEDEYCDRADGECGAGAVGVCAPTPADCGTENAPVCGCDGTTYDNACLADVAGVTVDHTGACGAPTACGGTAGDTCGELQYCARPEGECAEDAAGVCAPRAIFCSPVIAPVCGCDGESYDNACIARAVGVTVDHDGECAPTVCGGTAGDTCGEDEYCDRADGECGAGAVGVCAPTPADCGTENAPVCGCDGTTYDNACLADVAGVTVDHTGACGAPTACGGTAGDTCGELQYCARPEGECAEDAEGVCAPRAIFCSPVIAPVCGCDGESYDNACIARAVGVTVDHDGECAPTVCGGTAGDTCGEDEYCDRADGECGAGAVGVCAPTPADCGTENAPVCGCDGTTYDNACLADVAGVTVDHTGACGAPTACGGTAGDTCGELQYCARPEGVCEADAEGVCAPRPLFCAPVVAPVCGCDGKTYDNACIARAVGVTVASQGACPITRGRGLRNR